MTSEVRHLEKIKQSLKERILCSKRKNNAGRYGKNQYIMEIIKSVIIEINYIIKLNLYAQFKHGLL